MSWHGGHGPQPSPIPENWREPLTGYLSYLETLGYSGETIKTRRAKLRRAAEVMGVTPAAATPRDLLRAMGAVPSRSSKKAVRNAFVSFYEWYCNIEHMRDDNPAATLPKVPTDRPHPKPVPERALSEAMERAAEAEKLMLLLAAECGLRRAEIAKVHSDDVTGTAGRRQLIVHGKGGKQRVVPCPDDLAAAVLDAGGYLFPGRDGGHVTPDYVTRHIGRLLPDGYSAHKLRHRFATVAYASSHDLLAVARALGHASPETTMIYTALPDEALRPLVDAATITPNGTEHDDGDRSPTCDAQPRAVAPPLRPSSRADMPAPPRRANGDVRYRYDGKHGKESAATTPEAVRMALMLVLDWLALLSQGATEFDISAQEFAERNNADPSGHVRRSSVVRAAARRMASLGVVEIVSNKQGRIRGTIRYGMFQLCAIAQLLATQWAQDTRP